MYSGWILYEEDLNSWGKYELFFILCENGFKFVSSEISV